MRVQAGDEVRGYHQADQEHRRHRPEPRQGLEDASHAEGLPKVGDDDGDDDGRQNDLGLHEIDQDGDRHDGKTNTGHPLDDATDDQGEG